MSVPIKPKEYRLNLRLSEQEWNKIQKYSSNTTCRSVSEYCRKVLLNDPVAVFYRNQSFDKFEEDLAPLLPILKTLGDDFNELIKVLSAANGSNIPVLLEILLVRNRQFLENTNQIKELLIKIADTCAQA
jgi:hypothetical protein